MATVFSDSAVLNTSNIDDTNMMLMKKIGQFFNCESFLFFTSLCLAELMNNIVIHNQEKQTDIEILLGVCILPHQLSIKITYPGKKHDFIRNEMPHTLALSGRGVPLLHKLCHTISYTHTDNLNCISFSLSPASIIQH